MKTYPIMLNLRDRLAVVVGAGGVGLRKVRSLVEAGARVRLVCPEAPGVELGPAVTVVVEPYASAHVADAYLVYACTDDRAMNARIAADTRAAGGLVNAVDQPPDCDFFVPAVVADGDVIVAIGTGGSSPALAAMLKRCVASALPQRVGELAAVLAELRQDLRDEVPDTKRRGEIFRRLVSDQTVAAFLEGGGDAVRRRLRQLMQN